MTKPRGRPSPGVGVSLRAAVASLVAAVRASRLASASVGAYVEAVAPLGTGLTPCPPVFLRQSGSAQNQATFLFLKPDYLGNGSAIAGSPVTHTHVRVFLSEASARYGTVGTPTYSGDAGTASQVTIAGITPGSGYWAHAVCVNAGGESYPSHPISVTVTA